EQSRQENEQRIRERLEQASIDLPVSAVLGLERLASARSRLIEGAPQTRREMRQRWLNQVVKVGRVVAIGRSGKRLALVTARVRAEVFDKARPDRRRIPRSASAGRRTNFARASSARCAGRRGRLD